GARAVTAIIITGGQFDGHVDRAESFVDRHLSPRAGIAGVFPRTLFPGVVAELSWARDRMENPQPSAGAHIEGADVALLICEAFRRAARKMRGADEDDIARHDRSGVQTDLAGDQIHGLIVIELQIDDAA